MRKSHYAALALLLTISFGSCTVDPVAPVEDDEEITEPVSPEMTGVLTVRPDEIINSSIIGGGVNFDFSSYVFINLVNGNEWGTGNLRSQHIPYSPKPVEVDGLWKEFFELIDISGMQYVRLNVSFTMWEPINDNDDPFTTDFEKGFVFSPGFSSRTDLPSKTTSGFPNLNYAYMKAFYRLLDYFEEKGLYVILANWDNGSEALGFCPASDNWLASTDGNGKKLGRGNNLNVTSMDEYAETFAAIMYHLIEEKHYTCVKGFSFYNEPENLANAQQVLTEAYNAFGRHLTRLGIRNKTKIQAFDGGVFWFASDGTVDDRITRMIPDCGDNMDLISEHMYLSTIESGRKNQGNDVRGKVSTYALSDLKKMVGQAEGRPVVWGELGTFAFLESGKGGETSAKNYLTSIFAAEAAIEGFNNGLAGYGLWIYNCYYHNYFTMLAYDATDIHRIIPDRTNFYPSALVMSAFPGGTDILASEVEGCRTAYPHVWACVGKKPDGKLSILLVNDGKDAAALSISGLEGINFSYSYVTPDTSDRISSDKDLKKKVYLRPDSIVLLSEN